MSKLYKIGPSDTSYSPYFDPDFDMLLEYRNSYQIFKMEEHAPSCSCTNWKKYRDNAWTYSANLYFSDDKLIKIEETSTLNGLTYSDIYEFSDWEMQQNKCDSNLIMFSNYSNRSLQNFYFKNALKQFFYSEIHLY